MKQIHILWCLVAILFFTSCSTEKSSVSSDENFFEQESIETTEEAQEQKGLQENELEYELSQEEKEQKYIDLLHTVTDYMILRIAIDDFDADGSEEAFVLTVEPELYEKELANIDIDDNDLSLNILYDEIYILTDLWFLKDNSCTRMYTNEEIDVKKWEIGNLSEKQKYLKLTGWLSHHDRTDTYYSIENGEPKVIFTLSSSRVNEDDGTITSYWSHYKEEGEGIIVEESVYKYENGQLILISSEILDLE